MGFAIAGGGLDTPRSASGANMPRHHTTRAGTWGCPGTGRRAMRGRRCVGRVVEVYG